ncbi:MAG: hypothetical protein JNM68_14595, partial [Dinghuibacter sp.]|nr:hypothetical protein [Dinghuibacter sp.]
MKKKMLLLFIGLAGSAPVLFAGVNNGGFESTSGTVNCTAPNFSITRASNWNGIRTFYTTGNCATPSFASGTASNVDLFADGFTAACVLGPERSGSNAAHLELRGFYPNQTASAEWLRQTLTGTFTAGRVYQITAYLIVPAGPLVVSPTENYFDIGFRMVNTTVGSTPSAIIANARAQVSQPVTVTNDANGWVKLTRNWTCPTTGTYNLLIGPWAVVFCNDGNFSWLGQFNIDDVNVTCVTGAANAGNDRNNDCWFCCNPPVTSVTLGTAAVSGFTYSWSPATALSSTTAAQPTASPCGNTLYTLTVTSTGNVCPPTTDQVWVFTNTGVACCRVAPGTTTGEKPPFSFNIYPNPSPDGIV